MLPKGQDFPNKRLYYHAFFWVAFLCSWHIENRHSSGQVLICTALATMKQKFKAYFKIMKLKQEQSVNSIYLALHLLEFTTTKHVGTRRAQINRTIIIYSNDRRCYEAFQFLLISNWIDLQIMARQILQNQLLWASRSVQQWCFKKKFPPSILIITKESFLQRHSSLQGN